MDQLNVRSLGRGEKAVVVAGCFHLQTVFFTDEETSSSATHEMPMASPVTNKFAT
jgi:hypothetical protein